MAYVKTVWADGDVITATKLNNIETGLEGFEVSLSGYQPKGDYATVQDLTVYAPKSELAKYQPVGDYALKSEIPDLGQYVTKEELATDIQGLAVRVRCRASADDGMLSVPSIQYEGDFTGCFHARGRCRQSGKFIFG